MDGNVQGRKVLAVVAGTTLAAAIGLLATLFRDGDGWLVFAVFAFASLGPSIAAAVVVLLPRPASAPSEPTESIEWTWWRRASSGAFTDLLVVLGLALFVVSVTDASELHTGLVLTTVLVLAWIDVAIRAALLRRTEG